MTTDVHGEATGDAPHAADPAPPADHASSDPAQTSEMQTGEQQRGEEQPGDPNAPDTASPRQPFGYGKHRVRIGSQRWQAPRAKTQPGQAETPAAPPEKPAVAPEVKPPVAEAPVAEAPIAESPAPTVAPAAPAEPPMTFPPPRKKTPLPSDLERELDEALEGIDLTSALASPAGQAAAAELEPEQRIRGRVAKIHRDDLFVDLGGRNQGIVPLHHFANPPAIGAMIDVVVVRFLPDEGLYDIVVPGAAVDVSSWAQLAEGMVVDAMITGHNKGGLECEVSRLRGFIPVSQVALYRVENLEEFVGQKFTCVVTEVNAEKRNLVLSRRAALEREQAENKERLLKELAVGQVREGVVRRLTDFGAFVDLGGVDGLIHISQMSWERVKHPSEVLADGQRVKVKVEKIDPQTGKIGLSYRELFENPWTTAERKYPFKSTVKGVVSKIMDFGAFVKLEPGVEGLVHISELSHKRVFRVGDVVKEGQEVEALVLSVDAEAQRISLSMKALESKPVPTEKESAEEQQPEAEPDPKKPAKKKREAPLLGGGIL